MAGQEINRIALRMDDVGAASKQHEVYGRTRFQLGPFPIPFPGNFLLLKYIKPFRKWGVYPELSRYEWEEIFEYCEKEELKITLGITAGWVESSGEVTPFSEKYLDQAQVIKKAVKRGLAEVANHGYTHCVLERKAFRPRLLSGNREWHREFWDWIPLETQEAHIAKSQQILENFFEEKIVTFIPPGNIFTQETLKIAKRYGLRYVSCQGIGNAGSHLLPIPERQVVAFHDKELVEFGMRWLQNVREERVGKMKSSLIREIGAELESVVSS